MSSIQVFFLDLGIFLTLKSPLARGGVVHPEYTYCSGNTLYLPEADGRM